MKSGGGEGGKGGDSSHLGQPAVFYNGQRYSRIKEPTKTVLGRSERRFAKRTRRDIGYVKRPVNTVALSQQTQL